MKRALQWIGIGLGALLGVIVIAAVVLHMVGRSRLANAPDVPLQPVTVPTDASAVARGDYLVHAVSACTGCHGENLEGGVLIDEAPIGYLPAPNLTAGAGGIGASYTDADWERAIRHGVGADGRVLSAMPSQLFAHYSNEDLGALIAYLKQVPPVDNDLGPRNITFPGTILFGVLGYNTMPVTMIEHETVGQAAPPAGATAEYGEYLVNIAVCRDCHAANLAGNTDPNGPPLGPNLTPGGELSSWSEADFINTIRTGITPSGRQLSEEMPWQIYQRMGDAELQAIWAYLHSLSPLPDNP